MRKGLLFDCDGVLVDTRQANYYSYLTALETVLDESIRLTFTEQQYGSHWGESWRDWLPEYAQDLAPEVHRIKVQNYPAMIARHVTILPGLELLERWHGNGIPAAIVSNASLDSILHLTSWLETSNDVGFLHDIPIITPSRTVPPKPDPAMIEEASGRLGVDIGILIDDDIEIGSLTARRAGVPFIHFADNPGTVEEQIRKFIT